MGILDISQLVALPQEDRLARAYLQPVDLAPGERIPWVSATGNERGAIAFQYWPESVQDTRATGWQSKPVPGGSHPVREWPNGGERQISFVVPFSTDSAPPFDSAIDETGVDLANHDLDIRVAISWLRWFTYPHYGEDGAQAAHAPPKALLVMPNMKLSHTGADWVLVTVDQCDVTYMECFEDGTPKLAEVSLTFFESVVSGEQARFHDRSNMLPVAEISAQGLSVAGTEI